MQRPHLLIISTKCFTGSFEEAFNALKTLLYQAFSIKLIIVKVILLHSLLFLNCRDDGGSIGLIRRMLENSVSIWLSLTLSLAS